MLRRNRVLAVLVAVAAAFARPALAGPAVLRNLPDPPPNVNGFILTSPQGVTVFMDVLDVPKDLEGAAADPKSIFLVTHKHPDHYARSTAEKVKGQKLVAEAGKLASGDVKVEVVPSSHIDNEVDGRTNTILVVEVSGYRIVHLGDCAQDTLNPAQLASIGKADLVIGQLENGYADANTVNRKGYKVLGQLAPAVFVPTHLASVEAIEILKAMYQPEAAKKNELVLSKELFARGKRAVFMGGNLALAAKAGVPASPDL